MQVVCTYVLPVNNAESWLEATVERILDDLSQQHAQPFELLIIDDGSLDETELVCHQLSERYPQVTFVHRTQRYGAESALDLGLRVAKGDQVVLAVVPDQLPSSPHRKIEVSQQIPKPRFMEAIRKRSDTAKVVASSTRRSEGQ